MSNLEGWNFEHMNCDRFMTSASSYVMHNTCICCGLQPEIQGIIGSQLQKQKADTFAKVTTNKGYKA